MPDRLQNDPQHDTLATHEWALTKVADWAHARATLVNSVKNPSRLAVVHRLTMSVGGASRVFYLKEYLHGSLEDEESFWPALGRFRSASGEFAASPDLAPLEIIGIDPERRLLLTSAVEGPTIAALHHGWIAPVLRFTTITRGWYGAGRWLRALIGAMPVEDSVDRAPFLVDFTRRRLASWVQIDPAARSVASQTELALAVLDRYFDGRPVPLVACHGDVSAHNVVVGDRIGLIDIDDFRFEMAGLDVSQARIEIAEFSRIARLLRFPTLRIAAERAFRGGYGEPAPTGPDLWLPHLRNLVVRVLTLARKEKGLRPAMLNARFGYTWAIRELRRTVTDVLKIAAP